LPPALFFDTPLLLKETSLLPFKNTAISYKATVPHKETTGFLKEATIPR
jgi:hypothetical protein